MQRRRYKSEGGPGFHNVFCFLSIPFYVAREKKKDKLLFLICCQSIDETNAVITAFLPHGLQQEARTRRAANTFTLWCGEQKATLLMRWPSCSLPTLMFVCPCHCLCLFFFLGTFYFIQTWREQCLFVSKTPLIDNNKTKRETGSWNRVLFLFPWERMKEDWVRN